MGQKKQKAKKAASGKAPKAPKPEAPLPDPKGTDRQLKVLVYIAWIVVLMTGFAFSLKSLREPDLWWIFRTGEWILQNWQVPFKDSFSYTLKGTEWINVKWGFEVLATFFQKAGGPAFVYFLQALITLAGLYSLYRIYMVLKSDLMPSKAKLPDAGFLLAALTGLIAWEFRINGRPEAISHLFMLMYAYWLLKYTRKPGPFIYWLVLLQVIWTNFHEAYGTGIIMLSVFTGASWFDYFLSKWRGWALSTFKPLHLTYTTLAAVPAMAINPRGYSMIWHPWNIYQQLGANKFTTELFNFTHPNYWQFQAYINLLFVAITLLALLMTYGGRSYKTIPWYVRPLHSFGTGYCLFLGMFFYLSLTAYRNIPFFILISVPIAGLALTKVFSWIGTQRQAYQNKPAFYQKIGFGLLITLGLGLYGSITTNTYYEALERRDRFGLQVDAVKNPVQATRFIEKQNIKGRCFSDYLTSSYLLWHLRPGFKTFIDLRDLDVFPKDFFNRFAQMVKYPSVFNQADSLYKFDYVFLYRLEFNRLHQHLLQSEKYEPVFTGPVAVVYLKRGAGFKHLIEQYGLENQPDIFHRSKPVKPHLASSVVNHVAWPFFEASSYQSVNFDALAADYYRSIGRLKVALERAKAALEHPAGTGKGHEAMGNVYLDYASRAKNREQRRQYYQSARRHFQQALEAQKSNENALISLAALNLKAGRLQKAQKQLEQAVWYNPGNARAYQFLGKVYRQKANQGNRRTMLEQRLDYLEKAYRIDPDNFKLTLTIGVGYCQLDMCHQAKPYLKAIKNRRQSPGKSSRQLYKNCLKQCLP